MPKDTATCPKYKPLKLEHHEVSLWSQVFASKIQSTACQWAAQYADEAVLELRKRYHPSNSQGPYR